MNEITPEQKIADLEKQLADSQANEKSLTEQLSEAETNMEELNTINNDLMEKIEQIEAASPEAAKEAVAGKATIPEESFKVGKQSHVFIVPKFTNPLDGHNVITATEALTNKELLEYLVKNDCGVTKRASA